MSVEPIEEVATNPAYTDDLGAGAPVGELITTHPGAVWSVALTPDGSRIITGGTDSRGGGNGVVRVWDLATGAPVGEQITTHPGQVLSVALTPDGSRIITGGTDSRGGGNGVVRVWDLATGAPVGELITTHPGQVRSVALTPDGSRIITGGYDSPSGGGNGVVRVWDLATGAPVGEQITTHPGQVWSVALTPDGSRIITGGYDSRGRGNGVVRVWDLATGAPVGEQITTHPGQVWSVALTPDGSRIITGGTDSPSGGGNGVVRVWDLATGAPVGEQITTHPGQVWSVALTPDGSRIITGGYDSRGGGNGVVRVWDLATGAPVGEQITTHPGQVRSVALTPDGSRIITGGTDSTSGGRNGVVGMLELHSGPTTGAPVDETSPVDDGTIRPKLSITTHPGQVWSVALTPDGSRIITGGYDSRGGGNGVVRVWDLATGAPVGEQITTHPGQVLSVALTPDGSRIITGGTDSRGGGNGVVRVWDLATGAPVGELITTHPGQVWSVALTPDGSRIITGGYDSPSGGGNGVVRVWDLATGAPVGEQITTHPGQVWSVALTPDGSRIITGGYDSRGRGNGVVRVWDLATGAPVGEQITTHPGQVWSVALTPDGSRIITGGTDSPSGGGNGVVRVWDLATGAPVGEQITTHPGQVWSVALTPDGSRIITGGYDSRGGGNGVVRVWDLATGAPVGEQITTHPGQVRSVALTPDGSRIITGGTDSPSGGGNGVVRVWEPFGPPRIAPYASAVTDAESPVDGLNMTADVRTLAAMLAAASTQPPLSVALMGNWGSGKSTFMGMVIEEVKALAARPSPSDTYVTRIRQVRFNAWHYSDDHLWVGLIEHLFRQLRDDPTAAAASSSGDRNEVASLEAKLASARAAQQRSEKLLDEVVALDPERGWFGWLGQIRRAWLVCRAARVDLRDRMGTSAFWWSLGFALLAVLGIVISQRYGAWLHGWAERLGWVGGAVGTAAAVLAGVRQVWQLAVKVSGTASKNLVGGTQRRADSIRQWEDQLTRLDPSRQLAALLAEISDTDHYGAYRGLTGRIHYDLQRLDHQLTKVAGEDPSRRWRIILYIDDLDRCIASRVVEVLQAINLLLSMRLFLVVVAVDPRWLLRALDEHHGQLLNAKPTRHRDGEQHGRPLDYLDKIFHLPFAVRPMGEHAGDYLRGLLPDADPDPDVTGDAAAAVSAGTAAPSPHVAPSRSTNTGEPAARAAKETTSRPAPTTVDTVTPPDRPLSAPTPNPSTAEAGPASAGAPISTPAAPLSTGATPAAALAARPPGPITAQSLRLTGAERDFLPRLAFLLPTPRAAKKLSNLYRLLRISIPTDQLTGFIGDRDGGPYQAAALLLTAVVSEPGQAERLLTDLLAADPALDISDALRSRQDGRDGLVTSMLAERLADVIDQLRAAQPVHGATATYQHWARRVARYSFETYEMFTDLQPPH